MNAGVACARPGAPGRGVIIGRGLEALPPVAGALFEALALPGGGGSLTSPPSCFSFLRFLRFFSPLFLVVDDGVPHSSSSAEDNLRRFGRR